MLRAIHTLLLTAILCSLSVPAQAGWSGWKFWQKKTTANDSCCEESCVDPVCSDGCCSDSRDSTVYRPLFTRPNFSLNRHWLRKVCGQEQTPLLDGCCDDLGCSDRLVRQEADCQLENWIHLSQTAECPRERAKAVHHVGTDFHCHCYPEIFSALSYAMRDCSPYVRWEAADEIGDQIRKNDYCCPGKVAGVLRCGLNDESWRVRRECAQALRISGYNVSGFWGSYSMCDSELGCVTDSCCEGWCVDHSCLVEESDWVEADMLDEEPDAELLITPQEPLKIKDLGDSLPIPEKLDPAIPSTQEVNDVPIKKGKYGPIEQEASRFVMPNIVN